LEVLSTLGEPIVPFAGIHRPASSQCRFLSQHPNSHLVLGSKTRVPGLR
jgi:hypothetical protein